MSQTTLAPVRAAGVPQTTPDRATLLATAEYEALLALLRTLSQDDWGSVVVLQQLLRPPTQGSDLAIVGSTLAVAALFQPARQRIRWWSRGRCSLRRCHSWARPQIK
jgi:hypothetical protein